MKFIFVLIEIYLEGSGGLYPSIWYLKNVKFSGGIYQKRLDSSRARGYNIDMKKRTLLYVGLAIALIALVYWLHWLYVVWQLFG